MKELGGAARAHTMPGSSSKKNKRGTEHTQHPRPMSQATVLHCSDCTGPHPTVEQLGLQFTSMCNRILSLCIWFPRKDCPHCIAKDPFRTVVCATEFASHDLAHESMTVAKVHSAFHFLELRGINRALEFYARAGASANSASVDALLVQRKEVDKHYRKYPAKKAPDTLVQKVDGVLAELDRAVRVLPCKSKLHFECVDGLAAFTLHTMLLGH